MVDGRGRVGGGKVQGASKKSIPLQHLRSRSWCPKPNLAFFETAVDPETLSKSTVRNPGRSGSTTCQRLDAHCTMWGGEKRESH